MHPKQTLLFYIFPALTTSGPLLASSLPYHKTTARDGNLEISKMKPITHKAYRHEKDMKNTVKSLLCALQPLNPPLSYTYPTAPPFLRDPDQSQVSSSISPLSASHPKFTHAYHAPPLHLNLLTLNSTPSKPSLNHALALGMTPQPQIPSHETYGLGEACTP